MDRTYVRNPMPFDRPLQRTVQSTRAFGLDLDAGAKGDSCAQPEFVSPTGEAGIDNQEYRAMGCAAEWRGVAGGGGEQEGGNAPISGLWRMDTGSYCCAVSTVLKRMIMSK